MQQQKNIVSRPSIKVNKKTDYIQKTFLIASACNIMFLCTFIMARSMYTRLHEVSKYGKNGHIYKSNGNEIREFMLSIPDSKRRSLECLAGCHSESLLGVYDNNAFTSMLPEEKTRAIIWNYIHKTSINNRYIGMSDLHHVNPALAHRGGVNLSAEEVACAEMLDKIIKHKNQVMKIIEGKIDFLSTQIEYCEFCLQIKRQAQQIQKIDQDLEDQISNHLAIIDQYKNSNANKNQAECKIQIFADQASNFMSNLKVCMNATSYIAQEDL